MHISQYNSFSCFTFFLLLSKNQSELDTRHFYLFVCKEFKLIDLLHNILSFKTFNKKNTWMFYLKNIHMNISDLLQKSTNTWTWCMSMRLDQLRCPHYPSFCYLSFWSPTSGEGKFKTTRTNFGNYYWLDFVSTWGQIRTLINRAFDFVKSGLVWVSWEST